jgi:crotonobetainyl-CoA:carnitine CoA-transferase CaiB-like acyl-CoA transferase
MRSPLEGIKVLDFTQAVLGTSCTQLLGDLGSDVIKVEPLEGDFTRLTATRDGDSTMFLACNRSKRSIAVNVKDPAGKAIVLKLAKQADVAVENFRPGVMQRLGLGYEVLSKINPRIIYAGLYCYGETGPLAHRAGAAPWIEAFAGVVEALRSPESPPTLSSGASPDLVGGLGGAMTVITALFIRERTGVGQQVTVNQLDYTVYTEMPGLCYHLIDGLPMKGGGRGGPLGWFPYGAYTAQDGSVATIFGQDDAEWPVFCKILGIEYLLGDPRYDTAAKRKERRFELYPILDEAFSKKTRAEWAELFRQQRLRCDPCLDYAELVDHPQFQANDLIVELDHPEVGRIKTINAPLKFKATPFPKPTRPSPLLGEHTREILLGLGYGEGEIQKLHEQGVIGIKVSQTERREKLEKTKGWLPHN